MARDRNRPGHTAVDRSHVSNRLRYRLLVHGTVAALATATAAGVADALFSRTAHTDVGFLWLSVLIWIACAGPFTMTLNVLFTAFATPDVDAGWRSPATIAALQMTVPPAIVLWLGILIWVNIELLGAAIEPRSLIVDLILSLAAITGALGLTFLIDRGIRCRNLRRTILVTPLTIGAVTVVCLLGVSLSWSQRADSPDQRETIASPDKPDVVLILVDTLRRDHLSCEGYDRATSPAFDQLARSGVRFDRCISQSSHTKPAIASLLTSSYLTKHGAAGPRSVLPDQLVTVAEAFRQAGYSTGMFVSNPVVSADHGYAQGADTFKGLEGMLCRNTFLGHAFDKLRAQPLVEDFGSFGLALIERLESVLLHTHGSDLLMRSAWEVTADFTKWQRQGVSDPYFAYLHYCEPHAPYQPSGEAEKRFFLPSEPFVSKHPARAGPLLPFSPSQPLTPRARGGMIRAYDAEIAQIDMMIGRLVTDLLDSDRGENTLVVVTSDHGEEFYDHKSWGHGQSLYRELIEVPFVMAGPGLPRALVISELVELIDVAPTMLAFADVSIPETMQGKSLLPPIRGVATRDGPQQAVAEVQHRRNCWAHCLIEDPYKLIIARQNGREQIELYDLENDPAETKNLAPTSPEQVDRLRAHLDARLTQAARDRVEIDDTDLDTTTEERLRALGYLD